MDWRHTARQCDDGDGERDDRGERHRAPICRPPLRAGRLMRRDRAVAEQITAAAGVTADSLAAGVFPEGDEGDDGDVDTGASSARLPGRPPLRSWSFHPSPRPSCALLLPVDIRRHLECPANASTGVERRNPDSAFRHSKLDEVSKLARQFVCRSFIAPERGIAVRTVTRQSGRFQSRSYANRRRLSDDRPLWP
jgi:hypothetical protein